jgi:hypothetical protein
VMRIAKSNLKKQSQFQNKKIGVKSILIMVYGDFDGPRQRKNKANSKPICREPFQRNISGQNPVDLV